MSANISYIPRKKDHQGSHVSTFFDKKHGVHWAILNKDAPKRITLEMLSDLQQVQNEVKDRIDQQGDLNYQIFTSAIPGIFSLGGDLGLFSQCSITHDRATLENYARIATEFVYNGAVNYQKPVTTISIVKGAAFGGGFEGALGANVVIAEKQSLFSFPETRFGMFPGMGAFTLLKRRVPVHVAEEIIFSAKIYTAEQLHEMGVVDIVCEEGEGDSTASAFIAKRHRQKKGIDTMRSMVEQFAPVDREEMYAITDRWVDSALDLGDKERRIIEVLMKKNDLRTLEDLLGTD